MIKSNCIECNYFLPVIDTHVCSNNQRHYSQGLNCNSMEVEENAAYNVNKEEGGSYEMVPAAAPDNQLSNIVKDTYNRRPIGKIITTVATIALFLASLVLLAAAIALCINGTEVAKSSGQDNLESVSTLQNMIQILQTKLNNSTDQVSILKDELNRKNSEQDTTITDLIKNLIWNLGTFWNPVRSCSDLPPRSSSGNYWILNHNNRTSNPVQVYCDINRTSCSCDADGVWMRVANLDMTDQSQNCPAGFQQISEPLRLCGRPGPRGCVSTFFRTHGVEYSHVCGRIRAYQKGAPDAFNRENFTGQTIDSNYVDGISLTHGQSPRQHIWTFAAALNEANRVVGPTCPCTVELTEYPPVQFVPSFIIGSDYFCDTAAIEHPELRLYPDDPLWDGQGCGNTSTCCEFNTPPWFCRQLPQPTTDDIELRSCGNDYVSDEDAPIEQIEIYVQ